MNTRPSGAVRRQHRTQGGVFIAFLALAAGIIAVSSTNMLGAAEPAELAAQEKENCTKNLKVIYSAVEAFRRDHLDLPNWFSDLVPEYLPDINVLVCPVSRRSGRTEMSKLSDPGVASSYLFEFCPVPLGNEAPGKPKATRREWKRRQMGIVGSVVPIVRCRMHQPALNLAFDGRIYDSPPAWEAMLTNVVDPQSLTPARMFPGTNAPKQKGAASRAKPKYPARDPNAPKQLLDLSQFFNARLNETWHGPNTNTGNDLASLPVGVQQLGEVSYDLRGVIQLGSKSPTAARFPTNVTGIKVNQKCQKLHFLHAAGFGKASDEGKQVGAYVVRFTANQMRLEIPIVYGKDVRDWHYWSTEKEGSPGLKVAWKGDNKSIKGGPEYIRLFQTTWTNLAPDVEVESIDFVSSMAFPAPFLLAITLE